MINDNIRYIEILSVIGKKIRTKFEEKPLILHKNEHIFISNHIIYRSIPNNVEKYENLTGSEAWHLPTFLARMWGLN